MTSGIQILYALTTNYNLLNKFIRYTYIVIDFLSIFVTNQLSLSLHFSLLLTRFRFSRSKKNPFSYPEKYRFGRSVKNHFSYPVKNCFSYPKKDRFSYPEKDRFSYPEKYCFGRSVKNRFSYPGAKSFQ